jgi:hypothetical protein
VQQATAVLAAEIGCHTFRATGIAAYLAKTTRPLTEPSGVSRTNILPISWQASKAVSSGSSFRASNL